MLLQQQKQQLQMNSDSYQIRVDAANKKNKNATEFNFKLYDQSILNICNSLLYNNPAQNQNEPIHGYTSIKQEDNQAELNNKNMLSTKNSSNSFHISRLLPELFNDANKNTPDTERNSLPKKTEPKKRKNSQKQSNEMLKNEPVFNSQLLQNYFQQKSLHVRTTNDTKKGKF